VNFEKVVFAFVIILACTLNFGFFTGEIDRPEFHDATELFLAIVVNMIATVLKFGDRTQLGATHLATSLVATAQLLGASSVWLWHVTMRDLPMTGEVMATIVSLSGGALVANVVSVVLLIGETLRQGR
jgi:hypothetical protein